jgi:hypothetical protein
MTLKSKRASLTDPITGGILLVICVVTIFTVMTFWGEFKTQMTTEVADSSANATIIYDMEQMTEYYSWFDWGLPAILVGLMITSLLFALMSGASFIYSIVSIIVWAVCMLVSYIFHEIFINFAVYFPVISANYPIITFLMENINIVMLIWVVLISVVMFFQNRGGSGLKSQAKAESNYLTGRA